MPQTEYHVTHSGGANVFFGNDIVDGWPIGPVLVANNQNFFHDPHSGAMARLRILALVNAGLIAAGAGASGGTAPTPGTQNAWFRQGSGIPGQEVE